MLILLFSNLGINVHEGMTLEQALENEDLTIGNYVLKCESMPKNETRKAAIGFDNGVVQAIVGILIAAVVGSIVYYLI